MKRVKVALKGRSYDILIGAGLLQKSGRLLKGLDIGTDAVVVTNRRIFNLYGKSFAASLKRSGFAVSFEFVPDSEKAKSSRIATSLLNRIASRDRGKAVFLVALGGGVTGDLTGFVASIYKRGVPYIQVPTTLLAQVDSAIGGKTAIDLPIAKNLAGAFYQPRIVISDVAILRSLPNRQLVSAMAEIIKYGVIKDKKLFEYIERNYAKILKGDPKALEFVVSRASAIKSALVAKDELDNKGLRAILNYGHTAGHAIEAASSYSGYGHGESVAIGMAIAADVAVKTKLLSVRDASRIISLIEKSGLPVKAAGVKLAKIYDSLLRDKKFVRGENRFVLPSGIGRVKVVAGVPERVIKAAIAAHLK